MEIKLELIFEFSRSLYYVRDCLDFTENNSLWKYLISRTTIVVLTDNFNFQTNLSNAFFFLDFLYTWSLLGKNNHFLICNHNWYCTTKVIHTKGCLSLFNCFIDRSPTLKSPKIWFLPWKACFFDKEWTL